MSKLISKVPSVESRMDDIEQMLRQVSKKIESLMVIRYEHLVPVHELIQKADSQCRAK